MVAAAGFRAHAGWAAAVCLSGPAGEPAVLNRTRLVLADGPLPCEPYHAAKRLDETAAQRLVGMVGACAQSAAAAWIRDLATGLRGRGCVLVSCGIVLGPGRPEFTLRQALSTHVAMHNAEGWLFREALMRAARECGFSAFGSLEVSVYAQAAAAAGLPVASLEERVRELGRKVGPPWGKDQKLATAVAWVALTQAELP